MIKNYLRYPDLIKLVGLKNTNQVVSFLKQKGINYKEIGVKKAFIKYLIDNDFIKDFDVISIYSKKRKKYYMELFAPPRLNPNFAFFDGPEEYIKARKKVVSIEEHLKNFEKYKNDIDFMALDYDNLVFKDIPFKSLQCEFTNKWNSRQIIIYIQNVLGINYKELVKYMCNQNNNGKQICKICGKSIKITHKRKRNEYFVCEICRKDKRKLLGYYSQYIKNKFDENGIIESILSGQCLICGKKFDNVNSLSRHISRRHFITINEYINLFCDYQIKKCKCGNECLFIHNKGFDVNYYNEMKKYFYDYEYEIQKPYCNKCHNKNIIVQFKKVVNFFEKYPNSKYKKIIEEIKHNYKNISKYEIIIHEMMTQMREHNIFKKQKIINDKFEVNIRSNEEMNFIKNLNNYIKYEIIKVLSEWEINSKVYDFKYENHRYVPDYYFKDNKGNEYIFEIKSGFTLGKFLKNYKMLEKNYKKFMSVKKWVDMNKNKRYFYLILDGMMYNLDETLKMIRGLINETNRKNDK